MLLVDYLLCLGDYVVVHHFVRLGEIQILSLEKLLKLLLFDSDFLADPVLAARLDLLLLNAFLAILTIHSHLLEFREIPL